MLVEERRSLSWLYLLMLQRLRFYRQHNPNHYSDQLIHFSGVIGDNEDAPEDLIVSWSSSVDGDLILDTSPDADGNVSDYGYLTEGQHALELRVEDSSGKVTKEQLVVQVGGANDVPTCAFVSPDNQSSFEEGESICLRGLLWTTM